MVGIKHMTPARFDVLYAIRRQRPPMQAPRRGGTEPWFEHRRRGREEWIAHRDRCLDRRSLYLRTLREYLGLAASSLTEMVDCLVGLGILVKSPGEDPRDRRHTLITITEKGIALFNRACKVVFDIVPLTDDDDIYQRQTQQVLSPQTPQQRKWKKIYGSLRQKDVIAELRPNRAKLRWTQRAIHLRFKILAHLNDVLGDSTKPLYRFRYAPQLHIDPKLIAMHEDIPPNMTRKQINQWMDMMSINDVW